MRGLALLSPLLAIMLASFCACRKKAPAQDLAVPPAEEVAAKLGIQPAMLPNRDALYDAITKFMMANKGRAAKDVHELVEKGFLKPLPTLPPGKRYELDQRGATLRIVD
ncbi:MAG: hypothetical protein EB141_02740 [Verrucomicrobia bacterium]|nr:hypothetical protein [Verrucomicrobiota bacterium]NBU08621.1 hypothetical protein [Pseudomonadota bacterium]NDA65970.1 hypothetical protein [Verrucomicrobiota bacterium]NDB74557.1 hypothetical protein [Verrucomicrobiota bacterium]